MRLSGIIFTFFLAFLVLPAYAQDNKIRVINEDGSVSEVDLPGWSAAPPQETNKSSRKAVKKEEPAAEEESVEVEPVTEEKIPAAAPAPPAKKSAGMRKEQEPAEKLPPIPEYVEKKKQPVAPVASASSSSSPSMAPPVPGRKPAPMTAAEIAAIPPPSLNDVIHQNEAVGIALKYAPPSRDFRVLRRLHNGQPVYAVLFRTDNGVYEVVVDAFSGRVLEK